MPDPVADVAPLAARLDRDAERLRARARSLAAALAATSWDSPAGALARHRAAELIVRLDRAADRLQALAGTLRAHGRHAADVQHAARAALGAVTRVAEAVL